MIIEYIKPIKVTYDITLLEASKYLKSLKRRVIIDAITEITGKVYTYKDVKDRIGYKYTGVHGIHTFLLDGEELINFQPFIFKQNDTNEVVCSFEYKLLYKKGR